jgi:hypothetical protein
MLLPVVYLAVWNGGHDGPHNLFADRECNCVRMQQRQPIQPRSLDREVVWVWVRHWRVELPCALGPPSATPAHAKRTHSAS